MKALARALLRYAGVGACSLAAVTSFLALLWWLVARFALF
jgi:hypothetical protein